MVKNIGGRAFVVNCIDCPLIFMHPLYGIICGSSFREDEPPDQLKLKDVVGVDPGCTYPDVKEKPDPIDTA